MHLFLSSFCNSCLTRLRTCAILHHMITRTQLVNELEKRRGDRTWAQLAEEIKISPSVLSRVLKGTAMPGPAILNFLGLVEKTVYDKQTEPEKVTQ